MWIILEQTGKDGRVICEHELPNEAVGQGGGGVHFLTN